MTEYVVNAPPTRAVPAEGYAKGHYGLPLSHGYIVKAISSKEALKTVNAYRNGANWANELALSGKITTF